MRSGLCILGILCGLSGASAAPETKPATRPATAPVAQPQPKPVPPRPPVARIAAPVDWRLQNFQQQKQSISNIKPFAGERKFTVAELMQWKIKDGQLLATWAGGITTNQPVRLDVTDSKATWILHNAQAINQPGFPAGSTSVTLGRYDFEREDGAFQIIVSMGPNYFNVGAQYGPKSELTNVGFSRHGNGCNLNVTEFKNNQRRQVVMANAPSFAELQSQRPEEIRQYFGPLLREIAGVDLLRPGPADVYKVFTKISADSDAEKKLNAILPDLDVADYKQREAASAALAKMGRPGVLAALRVDPDVLTAEQRVRLMDFIAQHARRTIDPATAIKDVDFLCDAMEDDDPAVREAAKQSLEKLTGRQIPLDASLTGEKLAAAVTAARAIAKQPTTQPAAPTETTGRLGPVN